MSQGSFASEEVEVVGVFVIVVVIVVADAITKDVVATLHNKKPQIKAETAGFVSRLFCK